MIVKSRNSSPRCATPSREARSSWLYEDEELTELELGEELWNEVEAKLREWAFYVYHHKTFRRERDPVWRFVKALLASTRPIRNRRLVWWWYQHKGPVTDADIAALPI